MLFFVSPNTRGLKKDAVKYIISSATKMMNYPNPSFTCFTWNYLFCFAQNKVCQPHNHHKLFCMHDTFTAMPQHKSSFANIYAYIVTAHAQKKIKAGSIVLFAVYFWYCDDGELRHMHA